MDMIGSSCPQSSFAPNIHVYAVSSLLGRLQSIPCVTRIFEQIQSTKRYHRVIFDEVETLNGLMYGFYCYGHMKISSVGRETLEIC